MDYSNLDAKELLAALKQAGRNPEPALLNAIIDKPKALAAPLLDQLRAIVKEKRLNQLPIDAPERLEGVLIGRLCIELGLKGTLPILGELYRETWGDDVTVDGLGREPAHLGVDGIPIFENLIKLNTLGKWHNGKSTAITILSDIAFLHPSSAGQIQAILRSALPHLNENGGISAPKDEMWGEIAIALAKLQDDASKKQILAMIRQGVTDSSVITHERYTQFQAGVKSPRKPMPFDLLNIYGGGQSFEAMLANLGNSPAPEAPDEAHDMVGRAKRMEAQKKALKNNIGRNDPCTCGSGKKYKNCCGKK